MAEKRIVYFVGGRLSKALERPGKRIPLMYDFVSVMAEYADRDTILLTTLARLEDANVFEHECSECVKLAHEVLTENVPSETKRAFKKAFMGRQPESIEQLLENAHTRGRPAEGPSAIELVIRFNYAINRYFSILAWGVNWDPLEKFLQHQLKRHPPESSQHTFVSFNYDLILDRTVQLAGADDWNPFTGYGFFIRWYVEPGGKEAKPFPANFEPPPSDRIRILKPHGSLNWLVPQEDRGGTDPTGYRLKDGPVAIPLGERGELRYSDWIEPTAAYRLGSLAVCIIPPTDPAKRVNLGFIENTRCLERLAIESADEVYVLGWSIPVTDKDQDRLIRSSVGERRRPPDLVTVINRCETPDYFDRVAATFGVTRSALQVFNNGFSDFVEHSTS